MPRPPCPRRVARPPLCDYFKPRGVPMTALEEVTLSVDELEALRLADLEGLYQDAAAEQLGVSRTTFGRVVEAARRKVAEALVLGKALRIAGGAVAWTGLRHFSCGTCGHEWSLPQGGGRPRACPACGSAEFRRLDRGPLDGRGARSGDVR
ncbi:MAG: DUF134 domain-containing protein [Vicinamibacteria bacterium]|nr:DUF134 domain-containing protein [Vicinamibacteria bacterium]